MENERFKYENILSTLSLVVLFIEILGAVAIFIAGIVELNSYRSNGEGWIFIGMSIGIILISSLLHSFLIVIKEISINIKKQTIPDDKNDIALEHRANVPRTNTEKDYSDCLSQWK